MFGCTPGVYKNKEAVKSVAKGYSLEEGNGWIVMEKHCKAGKGKSITWYRPVRVEDNMEARGEGWRPPSIPY